MAKGFLMGIPHHPDPFVICDPVKIRFQVEFFVQNRNIFVFSVDSLLVAGICQTCKTDKPNGQRYFPPTQKNKKEE